MQTQEKSFNGVGKFVGCTNFFAGSSERDHCHIWINKKLDMSVIKALFENDGCLSFERATSNGDSDSPAAGPVEKCARI